MNWYRYTIALLCFVNIVLPMQHQAVYASIQNNDVASFEESLNRWVKSMQPSHALRTQPVLCILPLHKIMISIVSNPHTHPELLRTFFEILQNSKFLESTSFYLREALLDGYPTLYNESLLGAPGYYEGLQSWVSLILEYDRSDLLSVALGVARKLHSFDNALLELRLKWYCYSAKSISTLEQLLIAGNLTLSSFQKNLSGFDRLCELQNLSGFDRLCGLLCEIYGCEEVGHIFHIEKKKLAKIVVNHVTNPEFRKQFIEYLGWQEVDLLPLCQNRKGLNWENIRQLGVEHVYDNVGGKRLLGLLLNRDQLDEDVAMQLREFLTISKELAEQHTPCDFPNKDLLCHIQRYGAIWLCFAAIHDDIALWNLLLETGANPEEGEYIAQLLVYRDLSSFIRYLADNATAFNMSTRKWLIDYSGKSLERMNSTIYKKFFSQYKPAAAPWCSIM